MAEKPTFASSGAPATLPALLAVPDLVSLRAAVSNGALKGESLPTRIKLMAWGANPSIKGIYHIGETSAKVLATNQRLLGYERVALDLDHCSVQGSQEHLRLLRLGQPPIIFGYGRPAIVSPKSEVRSANGDDPEAGLWLEEMEYTPLGATSARNFSDLSPAVKDCDGEVVFIGSVALTTNGCLHDVTFFSATAKNTENTKNMSEANKTQLDAANVITVAEMAPIVGLAATASKADVLGKLSLLSVLGALSALVKDGKVMIMDTVSAIDGRLAAVEKAATQGVALLSATVDGKVVNFTGQDVVLLAARVGKLEQDMVAQASATGEMEKGKLITLFAAEGKVPKNGDGQAYTAEGLKGLDLPTLKLLHANTPATVPLSARSRGAIETKQRDPNLKGRERTVAAFEETNRKS